MNQVLLVEDSRSIATMLGEKIQQTLGVTVHIAGNLAEAKQLIDEHEFFCSILDLNLPDAPTGAAVEYALNKGIPAVVLTSSMDEELRSQITAMPIIDYVVKRNIHEMDYVTSIVGRLAKNPSTKILVVDDMRSTRMHIVQLLKNQRFQVFEAANGVEALAAFEQHPDIKLVITDYNMPEMDGLTLIDVLRNSHPRNKLAIIGLSASDRATLSATFLKHGANDYLMKPFILEEFYVRVNQNLEMIENIEQITDSANRDPLTKLHNRRFLRDAGEHLYASAKRGNMTLAVAMLDVDFFKKVNDTYGHAAGDAALVHLSKLLLSNVRKSDILARYGGEEIAIIFANPKQDSSIDTCEKIREKLAASPLQFEGQTISITASIGVTSTLGESFEDMLNQADACLYQAKQQGRNQTVSDELCVSQ